MYSEAKAIRFPGARIYITDVSGDQIVVVICRYNAGEIKKVEQTGIV